jgi:hypothetical protein
MPLLILILALLNFCAIDPVLTYARTEFILRRLLFLKQQSEEVTDNEPA